MSRLSAHLPMIGLFWTYVSRYLSSVPVASTTFTTDEPVSELWPRCGLSGLSFSALPSPFSTPVGGPSSMWIGPDPI